MLSEPHEPCGAGEMGPQRMVLVARQTAHIDGSPLLRGTRGCLPSGSAPRLSPSSDVRESEAGSEARPAGLSRSFLLSPWPLPTRVAE